MWLFWRCSFGMTRQWSSDSGFAKLINRYDTVVTDSDFLKAYGSWYTSTMREESRMAGAYNNGYGTSTVERCDNRKASGGTRRTSRLPRKIRIPTMTRKIDDAGCITALRYQIQKNSKTASKCANFVTTL